MRHRAPVPTARGLGAIAAATLIGSLLLCGAPRQAAALVTAQGYINFDQRQPLKLQLNAGLGGYYPGYGSFFVTADIFLTRRLSLPVGGQGFFFSGGGGTTLDIGLRYRLTPYLSLGGGLSGMVLAGRDVNSNTYVEGDFRICLELGLGKRFSERFGLSFNFRPTFGTFWGAFLLPMELDFAIYVSRAWAITLIVFGGPIIGYNGGAFGYIGGYAGFTASF